MYVCKRSCICVRGHVFVLEVMYLCVRGHVFVLGVLNLPLSMIFYWILGLFRQCDIFCFAFYLFYSLQNLVFTLSVGYLRDHLL